MTTKVRLDHELGEGQVRRAHENEDKRHGKALDTDRHDGGQPIRPSG